MTNSLIRAFGAVGLSLVMLSAPAVEAQEQQENRQPPTPTQLKTREATRLDSQGRHAEARAIFRLLIDSAATPRERAAAQRRMAMSYGFEGNCAKAIEYEEMVIDYWKTREAEEPQNAFYQQGEMANEAARVCIDAGDLESAERMYRRGSELGNKEPQPRTHPASLWDYRLHHALARIAARRGNKAEAEWHVAAARRTLDADTAMARQQERFYPYLTGYVALYTSDLARAESELMRALEIEQNQRDPFMNALLGMTYEKMGRLTEAKAQYQKSYDLATGHNPPAVFSRPFSRKKLGLKPE
jgi:tetratricopeptide (TPR) repeat protein